MPRLCQGLRRAKEKSFLAFHRGTARNPGRYNAESLDFFYGTADCADKEDKDLIKGSLLEIGNGCRQAFAVKPCTVRCSLTNSLSNMGVYRVVAHAIAH